MHKIAQKLEYLRWLKSVGIEYYFSEKKDSNISLIKQLEEELNKNSEKCKNRNDIYKEFKSSADYIERNNMVSINNMNDDKKDKSASIYKNESDSKLKTMLDSRILADQANSLDELRETVKNFNGCSLKDFAQNTVFSDGNSKAKIMLIGEAPGAKEDEQGIPFCGESGQLLDKILATIELSRKENIYLSNTIFWRPPANRRPTKQEIEICKPFVERHIALIEPKLIICIGSTAVAGLFGDKLSIGSARNNNYSYQNKYLKQPIDTMSIFHPAYLLRQPAKKKEMWFDLIKIHQFILSMSLI